MIVYFEHKEIPGKKHFRCERMTADLSVDSCKTMWRNGNEREIERFGRCKGCSVGAMHAGKVLVSMSPLYDTILCARCHRGSTRLIGRHICVSCWNRQRELIINKNARGLPPTKLKPLYQRTIRYICGGVPVILTLDLSKDTTELVVTALRDSRKKVVFAFYGRPNKELSQGRLF